MGPCETVNLKTVFARARAHALLTKLAFDANNLF